MLNLNTSILAQVVDQALIDAAAHPRWVMAIGRAVVELNTNPYIERQDNHLLIGSPSGAVYAANGVCQCAAYAHSQPCWHRAAARLIRLHDEKLTAAPTMPALGDRIGSARAAADAFNAEIFG